jgi:HSP20 family protein
MSSWDIEPYDWLRKFFSSSLPTRSGLFGNDIFDNFEQIAREMEKAGPLVKEYETPDGGKVREYGPFVYGYSMTIGPNGKPRVREFGNVHGIRGRGKKGTFSYSRPQITAEREALTDVNVSDNEVKVVVEIPGISKEHIKINAYDNSVEVSTDDPQRKYHQVIDIPPEADIETVKSTYKNGILEIIFKKKGKSNNNKGREIKVE